MDPTENRVELPALSVQELFAPVHGGGNRELQSLRRLPATASVRLRRAYILLTTGSAERAVRELNQLLFASVAPTPSARSFALYLRSRAYDRVGDSERSQFDLAEAAASTTDPALAAVIAAAGPAAPIAPAPAEVGELPLSVLARSDWGAAPPRRANMVGMGVANRMTVHHSAILARADSKARSAAALKAIQKSHMQGHGWADVGYHFLVDRAGRIWTGRQLRWQGAHAGDPVRNRGNIGICLLGNFIGGRGGQQPSGVQLAALQGLLLRLCREHHILPDGIYTHRELRATACPGERLQAVIDKMRRDFQLTGLATAGG